MKSKLQKIPDSVWMKLKKIQMLKEGWNMMTIANECLDLGANYLIKKLTKKEPAKSQEDSSEITLTPEDIKNIEIIKNTNIWNH